MKFKNRTYSAMALGVALLGGASFCTIPARASYIVSLSQVGNSVVAAGSGTINTADLLPPTGSDTLNPLMQANTGTIYTGASASTVHPYSGMSGPVRFGSGFEFLASSGKGDFVGIVGGGVLPEIWLPVSYISGTALSGSATYDNQTFSSLGVIPGSYTWAWGSGANADHVTLSIGTATAVPEPSSLALLVLPFGLLVLLTARRDIPCGDDRESQFS